MALINCYNCGKPVSQDALQCPHCHSSFVIQENLNGSTGIVFVVSCLLLCINGIVGVIAYLNNSAVTLFKLSPAFVLMYYVGLIGLIHAIAPALKNKKTKNLLVITSIVILCVRELLVFCPFLLELTHVNIPSVVFVAVRVVITIVLLFVWGIMAWKTRGVVKINLFILCFSEFLSLCLTWFVSFGDNTDYIAAGEACATYSLCLQIIASLWLMGYYLVCMIKRR